MALTIAHAKDETPADRLSYDEIFNICGNQRRRYALEQLAARGGSAELSSLAETVAMEETATPVADLDPSARKSVYNSLYQTHVPQLAKTGVASYDAEENVVALADGFEAVEPYIGDDDDRTSEPRSTHYFGLSLASGSLLALDSFDLVSLVPNESWPAVIVLLFTLLTLVYARNTFELSSGRVADL